MRLTPERLYIATGTIARRRATEDVDEIIADVWAKKKANDASKGSTSLLSNFFHQYLKNKYGMQAMVAKWAYSIMHALQQYRWDYAIDMFLLILSGEFSQDVYDDANIMIGHFKNFCERISDQEADNVTPGVVKKVSLSCALFTLHLCLFHACLSSPLSRDLQWSLHTVRRISLSL